MLDVTYEGLGGTGLVTTPLIMAPNLSECNVSHSGIALCHRTSSPHKSGNKMKEKKKREETNITLAGQTLRQDK